jgi:hypothetical protein
MGYKLRANDSKKQERPSRTAQPLDLLVSPMSLNYGSRTEAAISHSAVGAQFFRFK